MKSRFFNPFIIVLASILLCVASVSCKNFLNAGTIRDEIQEAIEIANSPAVTMYITVDEGSGSVIPAQIVKKKKESFELKFTPQPNWKFLNWEVIDRTTGELVPDAVKFQDPQNPETKATILKPNANYQIHAKCVLLPAIVSVSPANLQSAPVNSPIYITFNMPMEDPAIKPIDSIFKYGEGNVSINCGGDNMEKYFDAPSFFDTEKKVLVITPKTNDLKEYIEYTLKIAYIDLTVSFGKNIAVKKGDSFFTLSQESGTSVSVRYISQKETTAPVEYEFCVTNTKLSLETGHDFFTNPKKEGHFNYECIYKSTGATSIDNLMLENLTNGTIYIYGKYYDEESGVRAVTVKEKLVNNLQDGVSVVADEYTHIYLFDSQGADFLRDSGGNTFFCIESHLLSGDGAVTLEIQVSDVADNTAPKKNLVAIKKSNVDMDFTIGNGPDIFEMLNACESTDESPGHKPIDESTLKQQLKTFRIDKAGIFPNYYPVISLGNEYIKHHFTAECKYGDNTIKDIKPEGDGPLYWQFVIDVDNISGLEFTIVFHDSIGNTSEKTYQIPDYNSITYYKEAINDTENPTTDELLYLLSTQKGTMLWEGFSFERKDGKLYAYHLQRDHQLNPYCVIQENQTVSVCPQVMDDNQSYCFYPDFTNSPGIDHGIDSSTVPPVTLKNYLQTNMPVKIEKSNELCDGEKALKVTVFIDDNSWKVTKYDCIYLTWALYSKKMFDYGADSCSILLKTKDLYSGNYPINIYGVKNGKRSPEQPPYEILQLQDPLYDNVKPLALEYGTNFRRTSWDTFSFTMSDNESGLSNGDTPAGEVKVEGFKESLYLEAGKNTIEIPIRNLQRRYSHDYSNGNDYWDDIFNFSYWIYDNAGNCQYERLYFDDRFGMIYIPKVKEIINTAANTFTLKSEEYNKHAQEPTEFEFYKLIASNNTYKWELFDSKINDVSYTEIGAFNCYYESVLTNSVSLPADTYIRIIPKLGDSYGIPSYFYTGAKSYEKSDIIQAHTGNSVLIQSEQPAYVHTVVTTASYEECSTWDDAQWEYYNEYLGDDYLDFKNHPGLLEYTIPTDKIGADRRYVVIAHFASGKTSVSQVFSTPE